MFLFFTRAFEKLIEKEDFFGTALRLAIAGNIIDFAASDNFNLQDTIGKALLAEFAPDNSKQLKSEIEKAGSILYLGDNAGEKIVWQYLTQHIKDKS